MLIGVCGVCDEILSEILYLYDIINDASSPVFSIAGYNIIYIYLYIYIYITRRCDQYAV